MSDKFQFVSTYTPPDFIPVRAAVFSSNGTIDVRFRRPVRFLSIECDGTTMSLPGTSWIGRRYRFGMSVNGNAVIEPTEKLDGLEVTQQIVRDAFLEGRDDDALYLYWESLPNEKRRRMIAATCFNCGSLKELNTAGVRSFGSIYQPGALCYPCMREAQRNTPTLNEEP